MWQAAADAGLGYLDAAAIQAQAYEILWDDAYKNDLEVAERHGISRAELAVALATGEGATFEKVTAVLQAEYEKRRAEHIKNIETVTKSGGISMEQADGESLAIQGTIDTLAAKGQAYQDNKTKAGDAGEVGKILEQEQRDEITKTNDASQARWDAEAARYKAAKDRGPVDVNVNVHVDDSGLTDIERRVEALNGRAVTLLVRGEGMSYEVE